MYVIKAAAFILPIPFFKRFIHAFWVLEDVDTGQVIAELHGLATSRKTGRIVPIGYSKDHSLRAHHINLNSHFAKQHSFNLVSFQLPRNILKTVYEGEDSLSRWLTAVSAIDHINELDLDYPRCGFRLPFAKTINSNSIYRTLGEIMGIPVFNFERCIQIGSSCTLFPDIKHKS